MNEENNVFVRTDAGNIVGEHHCCPACRRLYKRRIEDGRTLWRPGDVGPVPLTCPDCVRLIAHVHSPELVKWLIRQGDSERLEAFAANAYRKVVIHGENLPARQLRLVKGGRS